MTCVARPTRARSILALTTALAACGDPIVGIDETSGPDDTTSATTTTGADSTTGAETTESGTAPDTSAGTTDEPTGTSTGGGPPSCADGIENQDETDIDCGGDTCEPCAMAGQGCNGPEDCVSMVCTFDTCRDPSCDDGVQNGDETDLNCGGSCPPCADSLGCLVPADCQSAICDNGACTPASCADGLLNGQESDVDCGGSLCPGCPEGGACSVNNDCSTLFCEGDVCIAVECLEDSDCGALAGDCAIGTCNQLTNECEATPAFTGMACDDGSPCTTSQCIAGLCGNVQPTDCSFLDSGCSVGQCDPGSDSCQVVGLNDGAACEDNDVCTDNTTCSAGQCVGGLAVDCSYLDNGCQVGSCNPFSGVCESVLAADGLPCDDGFACSTNDTCSQGACVPDNLVTFWSEDFADNDAGWTLGEEWEIGSATASVNCFPGADPGSDHTATADNGVAGVVLGGCNSTNLHDFYCLTSPVIDTSGINGPLLLDFWRNLHSDYVPFMQNTIDAYDGNAWQTIWASGPPPSIDDPAWTEIQHSLGAFAGPNFQVRFCFNITSGGVYSSPSWNLDDVALMTCP